MKRNRSTKRRADQAEPGSTDRRSFLRKASLGSVGALALASVGDVLASPAANASSRRAVSQMPKGRMTFYDTGKPKPGICSGESTCYPCDGCCGSPCKPTGVGYCFYCEGTCGSGPIC